MYTSETTMHMHNAYMYGMVYPSLSPLYEKFLDRTLNLYVVT